MRQAGFTLIEAMIALIITVILALAGNYIYKDVIPRQQVIADTNAVLGLIREARSGSITGGTGLLCDGNSQCEEFSKTRTLIAGSDINNDRRLERSEITEKYTLSGENQLIWKRFRGDALIFNHYGSSRYQNGSFYICNRHSAKRIVMNWLGKTRTEDASPKDCN